MSGRVDRPHAWLRRFIFWRLRRTSLHQAQRWAEKAFPGMPLRPVSQVRELVLTDDLVDSIASVVERRASIAAVKGTLPTDPDHLRRWLRLRARKATAIASNRRAAPLFPAPPEREPPSSDPTPEDRAVVQDLTSKAIRMIATLPEPHRSALLDHVKRVLAHDDELAAAAYTAAGRKRLERARIALRKRLS